MACGRLAVVRTLLLALLFGASPLSRGAPADWALIDAQIAAHPGETGSHVLDTGSEALKARAWLADHAQASIEVRYFIWSADNIGILATEALLRAAERGVKARVIVDDLLIDAPDKSLLALARHPNVDIRIYNPKHRVGTPLHRRVLNVVTDFRGATSACTTRPSSSTEPRPLRQGCGAFPGRRCARRQGTNSHPLACLDRQYSGLLGLSQTAPRAPEKWVSTSASTSPIPPTAARSMRANAPDVPPVFALHAKSMVVDGRIAYIGTFNFDPRSENLNTEVGAVVHEPGFARRLQAIMEADMRPENSWGAAEEPDRYVPLTRRGYVRLWQLLPLKPLR